MIYYFLGYMVSIATDPKEAMLAVKIAKNRQFLEEIHKKAMLWP